MLTVDIKTCILFIIQDMQEGDMLCGRFGPHTLQIHHHCHGVPLRTICWMRQTLLIIISLLLRCGKYAAQRIFATPDD
jgi:hypothetical protein